MPFLSHITAPGRRVLLLEMLRRPSYRQFLLKLIERQAA